jgi:ATP-dependent helicase YprA (DUF1998 family)
MDVFDLRHQLVTDYKDYVKSFIQIQDSKIRTYVDSCLAGGELWPQPLIQLNPSFEPGEWVDDLVKKNILHRDCSRIFRKKKEPLDPGKRLRLFRHQTQAVELAQTGESYVLSTGTGSGKSLAYIIPIVNYVLHHGSGKGIQAIVIYPMNALANSQYGELEKFIHWGFDQGQTKVKFAKYTGQENEEERKAILTDPPDILLTNYVMLELILTRPDENRLVDSAQDLKFLVLDELHTYRGRQGADVAFLVRRVRENLSAYHMQCIGTSATLASEGTFEEQQKEIAGVASQIFGTSVKSENVIGESLTRVTPEVSLDDANFVQKFKTALATPNYRFPTNFKDFIKEPLSIWLESTFGVSTEPGTDRLVRALPKSIFGDGGAAAELSELTGVDEKSCGSAIERGLLAGHICEPNPETGFPPFAFRLHQFISRGDAVYSSLYADEKRHITIYRQQYVPGDRNKILLPLAFCRECGQEFYTVYLESRDDGAFIRQRDLNDQQHDDSSQAGFLYYNTANPWPADEEEIKKRLPDDWLVEQDGRTEIRKNRRKYLPRLIKLDPRGAQKESGQDYQFIQTPFLFCLNCGVAYNIRQRSDFSKLSTLSSEGRSTATTVLSLSTVRYLQTKSELEDKAKKLLSFTDNRQDASLQAGHFNDFIEIGALRSALYRAVKDKPHGLSHDDLTQMVFEKLDFPLEVYAARPGARFMERTNTEKAFRNVLGYRLYQDLRRGWRINFPNLEQCGLLEIEYNSLNDICSAEDIWQKCHPAIAQASPEIRKNIIKVLLDFMRRELAIKVDYLEHDYLEKIQQQSSQYLISPWALDEDEILVHSAILFPRSRGERDYAGNVYLSARGGYGLFLRRPTVLSHYDEKLNLEETQQIINELLFELAEAGLLATVNYSKDGDDPGYQLAASALTWLAGDGKRAFHDPIRVPNQPDQGARTNPYFIDYYRQIAQESYVFKAREHTAQVPNEDRKERENQFKEAKLPILYCSPTMELGVDISELNVVNLRNVPPTPANYAQRSGRAGRSGQPAMVFTYCTTGSPHDQFFFKRPHLMVSGKVTPPRMDLANEDLIRAHVHAVWLAETGLHLKKSLKELLDLEGDEPSLKLLDSVLHSIEDESARVRAKTQAEQMLLSVKEDLELSDWYHEQWLDSVLNTIAHNFDLACNRWRNLYRSALAQAKAQDQIIRDATRSQADKRRAERLRQEAENQLKLLTEVENVVQSDFYSYRYFASEGFLPGYSFPRLPLSAYVPGRKTKQRENFLSRPRFLAISEFGPRAFIYHEGSRYIINRVILPVHDETLNTGSAKICTNCGYVHPITQEADPDLCEMCSSPLTTKLDSLFRLQNVSTKRRDKITSDEEERMRLGYELLTTVRFNEYGGRAQYVKAYMQLEDQNIAELDYGHTATIWRMNLGWKRRKNRSQLGFMLDVERGYWERNESTADDSDEVFSNRRERVIPFVEDRRNALILTPVLDLDTAQMASLQAALKSAIQIVFQLEDHELAVEPLPNYQDRHGILIYEAAEGGAGILRRILNDSSIFNVISKKALEICHFDPESGQDLRRAPNAREDCEAACYDCLLNYGNQPDHEIIDRQLIKQILMDFSRATIHISADQKTREEHLNDLLALCDSELERKWLRFVEEHNLRLPSDAQYLIPKCGCKPDFYYKDSNTAIYIDGPPHDFPERKERDADNDDCLEDFGFTVIRFGHEENWMNKLEKFKFVFGSVS